MRSAHPEPSSARPSSGIWSGSLNVPGLSNSVARRAHPTLPRGRVLAVRVLIAIVAGLYVVSAIFHNNIGNISGIAASILSLPVVALFLVYNLPGRGARGMLTSYTFCVTFLAVICNSAADIAFSTTTAYTLVLPVAFLGVLLHAACLVVLYPEAVLAYSLLLAGAVASLVQTNLTLEDRVPLLILL